MTRHELAVGSVTFVAIAVAGLLSVNATDRYFAAVKAGPDLASNASPKAQTPSTLPGACVDADGSWKNWVWANVPMLSPKCASER
jgi:hypothetical protein